MGYDPTTGWQPAAGPGDEVAATRAYAVAVTAARRQSTWRLRRRARAWRREDAARRRGRAEARRRRAEAVVERAAARAVLAERGVTPPA